MLKMNVYVLAILLCLFNQGRVNKELKRALFKWPFRDLSGLLQVGLTCATQLNVNFISSYHFNL